jgi:hypothetical protein
VVLDAADRGLSRTAGSLRYHDGTWWVHNDSHACLLFVTGDRGFRADLPPGLALPLQQWHAKLRLAGGMGNYTLLVRLPDEDDEPAPRPLAALPTDSRAITSVRSRPRLSDSDRLILAARFEKYLIWRYPGVATPCTAREAALEELATLLISTGELTADDLRRLPAREPAAAVPAPRPAPTAKLALTAKLPGT